MAKEAIVRNFTVGIIFLGSLVVLGAATLALGSLPFFFEAEAVKVHFTGVDNLQPGDDVLVHGYKIGQVSAVSYDPARAEAPITVTCSLRQKVNLTDRTVFEVRDLGPLGGRYVEVKPQPGNPAPPGYDGFVGRTPGGLFTRLENLVDRNEDNLSETLAEIREITRQISAGEGALGAVISDQELRDKVTSMLYDLSDVARELRGEKGPAGFLLNNEEAKEDVRQLLRDLREIARSLREGDGVLPRLLNDSGMGTDVAEAIGDVHDIVHKANSGEGTLAQVINNPKAWNELVRILVLVRETVEDLREQAPVSTFVNALFAVF
jgi:phospholipid/cholesterol/gamma-HCH transport system substrate-binding protein